MKKIVAIFLSAFVLFQAYAQEAEDDFLEDEIVETEEAMLVTEVPDPAEEDPEPADVAAESFRARLQETGIYFSGGVRTGLLVRHRDFGGELGRIATGPGQKQPMTLYFASYENNARIGEAWLNLGYTWTIEDIGRFGFRMGFWAHGGSSGDVRDTVHLGDRFVWANFVDERLRFIGGQGGGSPISSGGWINANWLSYAGLRFFWVDPSGFSAGIIFPDPGEEGISPVNYLSMLGAGLAFRQDNWWVSLQFDNSPIYDDTDANFYGGLRRPAEQEPIAMAGNVAFGLGLTNLFGGNTFLTIEGMFTNLGEDAVVGLGGDYTISPVGTTFSLSIGSRFLDFIDAEIRGRYTIRQGDASDLRSAVNWGKLEIEPRVSVRPLDHLRFDLSVHWIQFINSYYLALDTTDPVATRHFSAGQVPGFSPLLDFLSPFHMTVRPRVVLSLSGFDVTLGYTGIFSRDQVNNAMFIDFRWMF